MSDAISAKTFEAADGDIAVVAKLKRKGRDLLASLERREQASTTGVHADYEAVTARKQADVARLSREVEKAVKAEKKSTPSPTPSPAKG